MRLRQGAIWAWEGIFGGVGQKSIGSGGRRVLFVDGRWAVKRQAFMVYRTSRKAFESRSVWGSKGNEGRLGRGRKSREGRGSSLFRRKLKANKVARGEKSDRC
jgi:hypothetical protein